MELAIVFLQPSAKRAKVWLGYVKKVFEQGVQT
jgi:hypothetical protein